MGVRGTRRLSHIMRVLLASAIPTVISAGAGRREARTAGAEDGNGAPMASWERPFSTAVAAAAVGGDGLVGAGALALGVQNMKNGKEGGGKAHLWALSSEAIRAKISSFNSS